ncbi:hypothetical protein KUTeg_018127 [Tegillarca granosa]|uniref:Uncharacterized protein n=1 Tax=Tegillarca granosa TaxID=220873 RepID=A0ABQ9EIE6_TEGGR|nr:hypothetical protein KUTeg_018127 [Tegillarca granosa]
MKDVAVKVIYRNEWIKDLKIYLILYRML